MKQQIVETLTARLKVSKAEVMLVTLFNSGIGDKPEIEKKVVAIQRAIPNQSWSKEAQRGLAKRAPDASVHR